MLIASIDREGFGARTIELTRTVFGTASTPDFDSFKTAAASFSGSQEDRKLLNALISHWETTREFNRSVYNAQSPEDYKVRCWPNNAKMKATKWEYWEDIHEANIFTKPNRFIEKTTAITSAGSCFARNIARQLQYWKYNYIIEMAHENRAKAHAGVYFTDPAACGNIYNALSMRQSIERAFGEWIPPKILVSTNPVFQDPFRRADDYTDIAGYHAKWDEHNSALHKAFSQSEVFILTLGMTEAWIFADSGLATSASPRKGDPTLLRHKNLSLEDNVVELERLYAVFKKHNPKIKFITSVSPVPLNSTFNLNRHIVEANGVSKATLRIALDIFSKNHPEDVFYFPSYEIVTTATKDLGILTCVMSAIPRSSGL